jgi:uridine monophosphate synthetase
MLINVSRSISHSPDRSEAARQFREQINRYRHQISQNREGDLIRSSFSSQNRRIAAGLLESGCVRFGQFTLKSGIISPIYIDLRRLIGYPSLMAEVASAYLPVLTQLSFDRLAAIPYAALPIAAAISLQAGYPWIYPRREAKAYGTKAEIEGEFRVGERVVLIDDLATTGGSKFEGIKKLTQAGLVVKDIVVLIDRQSGAAEALAERGYTLHSVFRLSDLLDEWLRQGKLDAQTYKEISEFLQKTSSV